jgi:hypothetical protein
MPGRSTSTSNSASSPKSCRATATTRPWAAAEIWFNHLKLGGSAEDVTVKMAGESYIAKLRAERGERVARNAEGFIRRQVYVDPIASILLSKLNKAHCAAWRERILKRVGVRAYQYQHQQGRSRVRSIRHRRAYSKESSRKKSALGATTPALKRWLDRWMSGGIALR